MPLVICEKNVFSYKNSNQPDSEIESDDKNCTLNNSRFNPKFELISD